MIHSQSTTRVQMGDDTASDGMVSEDTINKLPSECQSSTDDNEGDQELSPSHGSDQEWIQGMNNKEQSMMLHQLLF